MSAPDRKAVWDKTGGLCFYCRLPLTPDTAPADGFPIDMMRMHMDHKIPRIKGGSVEIDNLVPACSWCNTQKNRRTAEEYRDYLFSLNIPATFMDQPAVRRDWLMVVSVKAATTPGTSIRHPHMRQANA